MEFRVKSLYLFLYITRIRGQCRGEDDKKTRSYNFRKDEGFTSPMGDILQQEPSQKVFRADEKNITLEDGSELMLHRFSDLLNLIPSMTPTLPSDLYDEAVEIFSIELRDAIINGIEEEEGITIEKNTFLLVSKHNNKACVFKR